MGSVLDNFNLHTFETRLVRNFIFFVKLCHKVHYIWWLNHETEPQWWDDFINLKKSWIFLCQFETRTQTDTKNISFSLSPLPLDKVLLSMIRLANMNLYVYDIESFIVNKNLLL